MWDCADSDIYVDEWKLMFYLAVIYFN